MSAPDLILQGILPQAIALEALESVQKVLFPLADIKSRGLLLSFTSISNCNFNIDMLRYESLSIRRPEENNVQYHYFGKRLVDLHYELMNPSPRGFEKWFERRSSPRFVMMATLAGVMLAIFLGLLGLVLAAFQTYIAYMAWKHPVQASLGP
ncbi:887b34f4-87ed-4948-aec6-0367f84edd97 [Sclerotinia trifoliorum]|uniref:887b34f4-87ed-4948-aec6-0367f84edd97 n=1 Tax=Sclerotinia trifoliorum TaxID=28548 RepID=A0A8H2ZPK8_9HELO|nr:887b34f4-87ed-4948-aec6-0367f84edd97 [Sclerotinia trifoliorum]